MASSETLSIVIDAKDRTGPGISRARESLSGLGRIARSIMQGVGLGVGKMLFDGVVKGARRAMTAIPQLAAEGAQLQAIETTFSNLAESIHTTADVMIRDLRVASRGMLSDTELMRSNIRFLMMGLAETSEEAAKLTETATQLGIAVGMDATTAMADFAAMLANQSIPRLDNFGISSGAVRKRIDELQEQIEGLSREDAFKMAVLEEGAKAMARVGDQSDATIGTLARLSATFQNIKDSVAKAAAPFIDKFAPVLQDFVDDQAPRVFSWLEKIGDYLFGKPGGMGQDPITGLVRIEPEQIGLMDKWAGALRGILTSISKDQWGELFAPLQEWVDSGEYQATFLNIGNQIGAFMGDVIAGALGSEETSNKMAQALGAALMRVPSMITWVTWGAGMELADMLLEAMHGEGLTEIERAQLAELGYAGTAFEIARHIDEKLDRWIRLRLGQAMPEAEKRAMPEAGAPLEGMPWPRPWQERELWGFGGPLRALPYEEVEVRPQYDPGAWRRAGQMSLEAWLRGAMLALEEEALRRRQNQELLDMARAAGVR